jgi:predicted nuclease of restriction endonuclease-like (RecB) superfamily
MREIATIPSDYGVLLAGLKQRIDAARSRAVLAANAEQIDLYHDIGCELLARRDAEGWGAKIIDRLAADLQEAFPEVQGFSARNLKYMRYFAEHCPARQFGQQPAAQLPWFHVVLLLTKLADADQRAWYAQRAAAEGWSRTTLQLHIERQLHLREGGAVSNFAARLPEQEARQAQAILKDPYHFDFLGLGEEAHERDIENALVRHVTRFLLELGAGFAFVGRQFRLEVGGDEFFVDLLFYHTRLKCYVVVELKAREFAPEHAGQLNFYLTAVDAQVKAGDDRPTIGLLLCRRQNRLVAEYALRGIYKPMGVAEYQLMRALPEPLDTSLPTIEQLEAELAGSFEAVVGATAAATATATAGGER